MIFQISLIVLCLFAVDVFAAPIPQRKNVAAMDPAKRKIGEITKFDHVDNADGSYYFVYETSDAQRREEHGEFKGGKAGRGVLTIQGTYSYTQPDGTAVHVQYIADDRGFRLVPTRPKTHAVAKQGAQRADALAYNDAALASGVAPRIGSAQVASLVGGGLGDNYEDESKLGDYKSEDYDY